MRVGEHRRIWLQPELTTTYPEVGAGAVVDVRLVAIHRQLALLPHGAHFSKHRHRMRYDALRRDDLDIATGAGEGAVRNLVRMRLDGPGMRWSRGRSEYVLHLRCILLNGQWDQFAAHLAGRSSLQLAATPTPTTAHNAAKKAA